MTDQVLSIADLASRVKAAFIASRVAPDIADCVTDALIRAECDGK